MVPSLRPRASTHVLVVDDDPQVRRALVRMVRRRHAVTDVADAEAALELLRAGTRFDAVVCDMHLGGMSGLELIEALRAIDPDQARCVVLLSGDPSALADAEGLGLRPSVLEKPVSPAELDLVLSAILRQSVEAA